MVCRVILGPRTHFAVNVNCTDIQADLALLSPLLNYQFLSTKTYPISYNQLKYACIIFINLYLIGHGESHNLPSVMHQADQLIPIYQSIFILSINLQMFSEYGGKQNNLSLLFSY